VSESQAHMSRTQGTAVRWPLAAVPFVALAASRVRRAGSFPSLVDAPGTDQQVGAGQLHPCANSAEVVNHVEEVPDVLKEEDLSIPLVLNRKSSTSAIGVLSTVLSAGPPLLGRTERLGRPIGPEARPRDGAGATSDLHAALLSRAAFQVSAAGPNPLGARRLSSPHSEPPDASWRAAAVHTMPRWISSRSSRLRALEPCNEHCRS
jgi:hypothetical protein